MFGEGNGNPLQYSCLENPMDGGAWWAAVHGVTRSRTRLSDFTFTFHFRSEEHTSELQHSPPHLLQPEQLALGLVALYTGILCKIFSDKKDFLLKQGNLKTTTIERRRKWRSTPEFLPGESHGWRSPVGYSPWGLKESDTTEQLSTVFC